jgi:hypothetical protein
MYMNSSDFASQSSVEGAECWQAGGRECKQSTKNDQHAILAALEWFTTWVPYIEGSGLSLDRIQLSNVRSSASGPIGPDIVVAWR